MDTIVNFIKKNDLILTALQNHLVLYTDDNREKERHMIIKTLYQRLNYLIVYRFIDSIQRCLIEKEFTNYTTTQHQLQTETKIEN